MTSIRVVVASSLLALIAGRASSGEEKKEKPDAKEVTVVPYDSKSMGALEVKSVTEKSGDWFSVEQKGKLVPNNKPRLDSTIELAPGDYVVRVNRTDRKVTVEAGKKTILLTGELVVEAQKGTPGWYTPFVGKEAKLAAAPPLLNHPIALFAGKYAVEYRESGIAKPVKLGNAEIKPGRQTVLKK